MSSRIIRIKSWPFEKEEKIKLIWIGEPFKQNNKWMVYAYFKGKTTRKIALDWGTIHFLSVDKYYTDGVLNNGETISNTEAIDINLSNIKAEYREKDWEIWGTGFRDKTKSKTFNFIKDGTLYTIPIIEIIRAVIAPDVFMLHRVIEMDTLENYFTYEIKNNKLDIHFTSEYESKLLKNEKINHLAWLITNERILKMFNSIANNIWSMGELKFDFLFDKFSIKARVERREKFVRILQILALNKKRINVEEINIFHPSLEKSEWSEDINKKRQFKNNESNNRDIDSSADGATKDSEVIDTFMIAHDYEMLPRINKKQKGIRIRRKREDENTKTYIIDDNNLRTTADKGGEELVKGLEFANLSTIKENGELQEFIHMLKLLEKKPNIKSVEIIIGELPEGTKGKKFSKLSDGVTKRKYAIGKIRMVDSRENYLIDIEREDRALSMLLLKGKGNVQWQWLYSMLLLELVNGSGKWSSDIIMKMQKKDIIVIRKKHIKKSYKEKMEKIYESLL